MLPQIPSYSLPQIMVRGLRDHPGSAIPKCIGAIASLKIVRQISGESSYVTIQQFKDLANVYFQFHRELT
jgi:hypothetical protein